mgnify:CR=1 FL=1
MGGGLIQICGGGDQLDTVFLAQALDDGLLVGTYFVSSDLHDSSPSHSGGGGALLNAPRPYSLLFLKSPGQFALIFLLQRRKDFSPRRGAGAQAYFVYVKYLQRSIGGKDPAAVSLSGKDPWAPPRRRLSWRPPARRCSPGSSAPVRSARPGTDRGCREAAPSPRR